MNDKSICALELTSSGIKLVIGYLLNDTIYVLHALTSSRCKLVKGAIVDSDDMRISIQELVNSASKTLKEPIDSVILGIPSLDISIEQLSCETNTTDPASVISFFDGSNCLHMIEKKKVDPEGKKVVLDVVPFQYTIDNNQVSREFPYKKKSLNLGMQADVEVVSSVLLNSFEKAVKEAGLRIIKPIDTSNASIKFISSFQKSQQEFIFIDFGAKLSTICFAFDGRLLKTETVNFGSDDITDAIAAKFGVDHQTAEHYKCVYGISKDPDFDFAFDGKNKVSAIGECIKKSLAPLIDGISQFEISIDASARNLFIPSGGGADLLGLDTYLYELFQNRILLFTPPCYGARDKVFTNCIAMIRYYATYELKSSPSRPVDLTLTRIVPSVDNKGNVNPEPKEEESEQPQPSYSGLEDEKL